MNSVNITSFREAIQGRDLEEPFDNGREAVHVLVWPKKDPRTGENIGLMMKCERVSGVPAAALLPDADTAKKYLFLVKDEVHRSTCLVRYDKTDWASPGLKVLVIRPEEVAGVPMSLKFERSLADGFLGANWA